jgi:hypothetical protein
MKRILARLALRLVLDSMILALQVRAVAYGIAADLVGLEIRVKDRLWGRDGW